MKGPVTEAYVLHIGKRSKLCNIKYLDLSNHNLDILDVSILNKLTSLEALDLSWNKLTHIPAELTLKKLRVLDCSNNDFSTVEFVGQFNHLDELHIDDNDNLLNDDMYIAKTLLPNLRRIDSTSDLGRVQIGIKLFRGQLTPQIRAVWEAKYSEVYSSGVSQSELDKLLEDFIEAVESTILNFNSDLPKFRKYMIRKIAREVIDDVNNRNENAQQSLRSSDGNTPISSYRTRVKMGSTPIKDYSQGIPMDISDQTLISRKRKRESTSEDSPSLKKKRTDTPDKHLTNKPTLSEKNQFTALKKKETVSNLILPMLPDYDPVQVLRCHSQDNSPCDDETKIWKCAFEPGIGKQGETTEIVASCGGCIVCFIDCHTCKVMRRYKDNSNTESFYCLAWTTLQADGDRLKDDANILAVAGQDGTVKLIYPRQLVKYAALEGHKDYVSSLVFHPSKGNILFSGSRDGLIIQWDIGVPDFKDYKSTKWSKLSVMRLNKTDAISMVISPTLNVLIAGCEESCFGWKLDGLEKKEKAISPDYEFIHPKHSKDMDEVVTVDSLSIMNNSIIVSKCVGSSSLYLWDLESTLKKAKKSSGCSRIPLLSIQQLEYVPLDVDYLYTTTCKDVLVIGDDKGNVHMYNLKQVLQKKTFSEDQLLLASNILRYPQIETSPPFKTKMEGATVEEAVVNSVTLSSSEEFLVYGTDSNLICIWKKTQ